MYFIKYIHINYVHKGQFGTLHYQILILKGYHQFLILKNCMLIIFLYFELKLK